MLYVLFESSSNISLAASCSACFFFSSRRRHTRFDCDWSSDVCSSDLEAHLARVDVVPLDLLECGDMELPAERAFEVGELDHRDGGARASERGAGGVDRKSVV